jgi:two-component system, sensor histidine kinase
MADTPTDTNSSRLLDLSVHEFRSPISVALGYLKMVTKDPAGSLDERYGRMLHEAEKSCARLTALVAEMSDVSDLEAQRAPFRSDPVDLHAVLAEAIAALPPVQDRALTVALTTSPTHTTIRGDARRLRHAFTSILFGLRRELVTSDQLHVRERIGTYQDKPASWIAIAEASHVDALATATADSLIPFWEWRGGCGLSLPIARRTIDRHKGCVWSPPKPTSADGREPVAADKNPTQPGTALIVLPH